MTFYVDAANLKGLPTWVSSLTGETGYVQPIVSGQTGETGKIASFAVPPKQAVLPTGKSQRLLPLHYSVQRHSELCLQRDFHDVVAL